MPNKLVNNLSRTVDAINAQLQKHLEEGIEVKLAIARLQEGQRIVTAVVFVLLTAVVGLYFKK